MDTRTLPQKIGIVGGGQLAKMTVQMAKKLGFYVTVLDPTPRSPAAQLADEQIEAGYHDVDALRQLVEASDVTTYDLEGVDAEALVALTDQGHIIRPAPSLLLVIQDKLRQRQLLAKAGIPQPRFAQADEPGPEAFGSFGFPLVQKLRKGGYDGRGVQVINSAAEAAQALPGPSLLEEKVDIDKELAVMVARAVDGDECVYPVVEMTFDHRANILDLLLAPARITPQIRLASQALARDTVRALDGVGIFGVELFLDKAGNLTVNEVAPRPHNSGHYTYEACVTNQFEQHLRAIAGLPLGSPEQMRKAVMLNVLGEPDANGEPQVEGIHDALSVPGVSLHIYGKAQVRPFRKMGHVTVLDSDLDRACRKAREVREVLHLRGDA